MYIGSVRLAEFWLKLAENTILAELLWKKNIIPAQKRSRTSRLLGKPNGAIGMYILIGTYFVNINLNFEYAYLFI